MKHLFPKKNLLLFLALLNPETFMAITSAIVPNAHKNLSGPN